MTNKNLQKEEQTEKRLFLRFIISVAILAPLMYVATGYSLGAPVPFFIDPSKGNARWYALFQAVLAAAIIGINYEYFKNGAVAVFKKMPNIDTLVALSACASFVYSAVLTVLIFLGKDAHFNETNLHFESAAMILAFSDIGKWLEYKSLKNTRSAIADRVAGIFVPLVVLLALATFLIWLLIDGAVKPEHSVAYAINVLAASCPCAWGLVLPASVMAVRSKASSYGIKFKDVGSLQKLNGINAVLLDNVAFAEGSKDAVSLLKARNMRVAMLTDEESKTAKALAESVGIDDFLAEVTAEDKIKAVENLQKVGGCVAMVADGINDSIALERADVGIVMGGTANAAIDSAVVVLASEDLRTLDTAFDLSLAAVKNVKQNYFWVLFYNAAIIPVAAGAFSALGFLFSSWLIALVTCVSSLFVVCNALKLLLYKNKEKGDNFMKKIIRIEGMCCEHCAKRVEEKLATVKNAVSADVKLKKNIAIIRSREEVSNDEIIALVEEAGFKVTEIESK